SSAGSVFSRTLTRATAGTCGWAAPSKTCGGRQQGMRFWRWCTPPRPWRSWSMRMGFIAPVVRARSRGALTCTCGAPPNTHQGSSAAWNPHHVRSRYTEPLMRPQPQDTDFRTRVKTSFSRQAFMATIGASLELVEPGEVHIALPFSAHLSQQHGYLHAGATTAIADSANGYAALTLAAAD